VWSFGVLFLSCVCVCDLFLFLQIDAADGTSWPPYMLNRYSRIPGTQPQEYEYHIPPSKPVLDRNMFIFKVTVFLKRAKYE